MSKWGISVVVAMSLFGAGCQTPLPKTPLGAVDEAPAGMTSLFVFRGAGITGGDRLYVCMDAGKRTIVTQYGNLDALRKKFPGQKLLPLESVVTTLDRSSGTVLGCSLDLDRFMYKVNEVSKESATKVQISGAEAWQVQKGREKSYFCSFDKRYVFMGNSMRQISDLLDVYRKNERRFSFADECVHAEIPTLGSWLAHYQPRSLKLLNDYIGSLSDVSGESFGKTVFCAKKGLNGSSVCELDVEMDSEKAAVALCAKLNKSLEDTVSKINVSKGNSYVAKVLRGMKISQTDRVLHVTMENTDNPDAYAAGSAMLFTLLQTGDITYLPLIEKQVKSR